MRDVHTYRICALASAAMVPIGGARDELLTVAIAGVASLVLLRMAVVERQRELDEAERLTADAYREIGEALGGTISHVRLVRPYERLEIDGLDMSTPAWRVERAPVRPGR